MEGDETFHCGSFSGTSCEIRILLAKHTKGWENVNQRISQEGYRGLQMCLATARSARHNISKIHARVAPPVRFLVTPGLCWRQHTGSPSADQISASIRKGNAGSPPAAGDPDQNGHPSVDPAASPTPHS